MKDHLTRETSRSDRWRRWGLWAGVVYAILLLASSVLFISTIVPALPPPDSGSQAYADLYRAKAGETRALLYIVALSLPFLLAFLGSLAEHLRVRTASPTLATTAALAGLAMGVIAIAGNAVQASFGTTLARLGGDPAAVQAIDGLIAVSNGIGALPRALLLTTVAVGILEYAMAPRWIGWTALVLAVVSLVGSLAVMVPAVIPFLEISALPFAFWLIALCVSFLRRSPIDPHTPSALT